MLILCGPTIVESCGVAQPLFDYYEKTYFQRAIRDGCYCSYPRQTFYDLIGRLVDAMFHLDGVNYGDLTKLQINKYQRKIIFGKYGFDLLYLFMPIDFPSEHEVLVSPLKRQSCTAELERWLWAKDAWKDPETINMVPDYISNKLSEINKAIKQ